MTDEPDSGRTDAPTVRVLFDGDVEVEHTFISFEPDDLDVEIDHVLARQGQANGLCGATYPGVLSMNIGTQFGTVPMKVELHTVAPDVHDGWEDVVEVSLSTTTRDHWIVAVGWAHNLGPLRAGTYRARWCANGLDEARDGTLPADHDPTDRTVVEEYLLQLWPARPAPDAVVRHGSAVAASWHQQATGRPSLWPVMTGSSKKRHPANQPATTHRGQVSIPSGRTWYLHDPHSGPVGARGPADFHVGQLEGNGAYFLCEHDATTVDVTVDVYHRTPPFPRGWSDVSGIEAVVPSGVVWAYSPPFATAQERGCLPDIELPNGRFFVRAAVNGFQSAQGEERWLIQLWPNPDQG